MYRSAYDEDSLFSEPAAAVPPLLPRNSNAGAASFLLDSVVSAARSRSALVAHDEDDYSDGALAQLSRRQDALDEKTARVTASVALLTNAILSSDAYQQRQQRQLLLPPPPHPRTHRSSPSGAWPSWGRAATPPPPPAAAALLPPRSHHKNGRRRHGGAGREAAGMGGRLSPPPPPAAAVSASQQRRRAASPPPPVAARWRSVEDARAPAPAGEALPPEGALSAAQHALEAQAAELAAAKLQLRRQEELHLRYAEERAAQVEHLERWNDSLLGEMMLARGRESREEEECVSGAPQE